MSTKDGGPAFPVSIPKDEDGPDDDEELAEAEEYMRHMAEMTERK